MLNYLERLIRGWRARWAVSRIRSQARATGSDTLTQAEIEAEIRAVRDLRVR